MQMKMKGYKALDKDMRAIHGNGMRFELGWRYAVDGEVVPCKNGFHFCEDIGRLSAFYNVRDGRIFEIEACGRIVRDGDKCAAESVRLMRELERREVDDYFSQNWRRLVTDGSPAVRMAVAERGHGLDALVHDEDRWVRMAVAKRGHGLGELVHDEDWGVRAMAKGMMNRRESWP